MKFYDLPRMPGPLESSLTFIVTFLRELKQRKQTTREQAVEWVRKQYKYTFGYTFALNAIQLLTRLNICAETNEKWYVGPVGNKLLKTNRREEQGRLVAIQLIRKVHGVREILEICVQSNSYVLSNGEINEKLQQHYRFKRPLRAAERTEWLRVCLCLESVGKFGLSILPLGLELVNSFAVNPASTYAAHLAHRLQVSTLDSDRPGLLVAVLALCFRFLGFAVEVIETHGDTDLLVTCPFGERLKFIVDGKTSRSGRVGHLNASNVARHREMHGAQRAMLVGYDFERGQTVLGEAKNFELVLLPVSTLQKVLELQASLPQGPEVFLPLIENWGVLDEVPQAITNAFISPRYFLKALLEVFRALSSEGDPASSLTWTIKGQSGVKYPPDIIDQALAFLSYGAGGVVRIDGDNNVTARMNAETFAAFLDSLAQHVKELSDEG